MTDGRSKGFKHGRDNKTGQFVPLKETERRPQSTTREIVPKRGNGDSGRYDKKQK
jgi:hypothetical protein